MQQSFNGFINNKKDSKKSSSNIKSIQSGTVTATSTSVNISINAVDISKCLVFVNAVGNAGNNAAAYFYAPIAKLTSSTVLNITTSGYAAGSNANFTWRVVEFNNVKSLQTGTLVVTTTPTNVTISEVNASKCILLFSSYGGGGSSGLYYIDAVANGQITSPTNLSILGGTGFDKTAYWQIIEFL